MRFLPLLMGLVLAVACGPSDRHPAQGIYDATGVVVSTNAEYAQAVIDHDDIEGLMPAMTMNFDVPDPALLGRLAPGQRVAFRVQFTGRAYRVIDAQVVGESGSRGTQLGIENAAPADEPAPDFALVDQDGSTLALADLRGRALLLDFMYTNCDGPCPIQTAAHVEVLNGLPDEVRERVHFVSISLDPARDDPPAMRAYAEARSIDLERWSFLTGDAETVAGVLERYGVGVGGTDGDQIEHMIITYLIDGEGVVIKRYLGMDHATEELQADLVRLVSGAPAA